MAPTGAREVSLLVLALLVMVWALLGALQRQREPGEGREGGKEGFGERREGLETREREGSARRAWLWVVAAVALLVAVYSYPGGVIVAPLLAMLVVGRTGGG